MNNKTFFMFLLSLYFLTAWIQKRFWLAPYVIMWMGSAYVKPPPPKKNRKKNQTKQKKSTEFFPSD